jgi:hypothetical protein
MKKEYIKSFSTKEHMMIWWRDFRDDIICYEIGGVGEYKVRFTLKSV